MTDLINTRLIPQYTQSRTQINGKNSKIPSVGTTDTIISTITLGVGVWQIQGNIQWAGYTGGLVYASITSIPARRPDRKRATTCLAAFGGSTPYYQSLSRLVNLTSPQTFYLFGKSPSGTTGINLSGCYLKANLVVLQTVNLTIPIYTVSGKNTDTPSINTTTQISTITLTRGVWELQGSVQWAGVQGQAYVYSSISSTPVISDDPNSILSSIYAFGGNNPYSQTLSRVVTVTCPRKFYLCGTSPNGTTEINLSRCFLYAIKVNPKPTTKIIGSNITNSVNTTDTIITSINFTSTHLGVWQLQGNIQWAGYTGGGNICTVYSSISSTSLIANDSKCVTSSLVANGGNNPYYQSLSRVVIVTSPQTLYLICTAPTGNTAVNYGTLTATQIS